MSSHERQQRPADLTGDEWLSLLAGGEIEVEGRLPWSSNYSFLVSVSGTVGAGESGERISRRAVYKPGRGERPLWDFGPDLFRREVAAFELSAFLGISLVPETVLRLDAPLGAGSVQRFIEADFEEHYFTLLEREDLRASLRELAAFDVIANNADRKAGHVLIDCNDHIWGIDNGLSFHTEEKLRTVIWDFAGEPVPERLLSASGVLAEGAVPPRVAELLRPDECAALTKRARSLLRRRRLPAPRDDYRSYPWPLV